MDVPIRVIRVLQSMAQPALNEFLSLFTQSQQNREALLDEWEKKHNINPWTPKKNKYPKQLTEDLALFDLQPPVKFKQVKEARNQALKQFHPDKFQTHPKKLETAEQIVKIYNAAYARLAIYYKNDFPT